jgi:predicted solute-binding protein
LNISRRTLYRWTKNYKKFRLEGLINKRGLSRKGNAIIAEELWKRFKHYSVVHAVNAAKKSKNPDNLEHHEDVSSEEGNPLSDYFEKVLKSMEGN